MPIMNNALKLAMDSTVYIAAQKDDQITFRATGVLLKHNQVLITWSDYYQIKSLPDHKIICGVRLQSSVESNIYNYKIFELELLKNDNKLNLALCKILNVDSEEVSPSRGLEFIHSNDNNSTLAITDKIYYSSFPFAAEFINAGAGITLTVSESIIASLKYRTIDEELDFILIDKELLLGQTGAPVFTENNIIGITVGKIASIKHGPDFNIELNTHFGVVRPSKQIEKFINDDKLKLNDEK